MKLLHIIPASGMLPTLSTEMKTRVTLQGVRRPVKKITFSARMLGLPCFLKRRDYTPAESPNTPSLSHTSWTAPPVCTLNLLLTPFQNRFFTTYHRPSDHGR